MWGDPWRGQAANGSSTSRDVEAHARGHPDPVADVLLQAPDVGLAHDVADPGALLRPPECVLDEDRQQPVGSLDQPLLRLLRRPFEQDALVGDARAVVDAVVDREPVAEVLEEGAARRACDQPEARDDQPLEEDLHLEHLLLERLRLERHLRQLVEVRVALGDAARLLDELQPRLDVPRLVLHHRRVVELRLVVRAPGSAAAPPSSTASSSACSCCVITERQTACRRSFRSGEAPARVSGIGGISPQACPAPATPASSRARRSAGRRGPCRRVRRRPPPAAPPRSAARTSGRR